jgi:hypothetical protein
VCLEALLGKITPNSSQEDLDVLWNDVLTSSATLARSRGFGDAAALIVKHLH